MGLIEKEEAASNNYKLAEETIDGEKIVKLTRDNVARVEAMIRYNSDYRDAGDENKGIIKNKKGEIKYIGSSTYWLKQLKEIIYSENKKTLEGFNFEEIIENLVISIDNENSTHLNSDNKKRKECCYKKDNKIRKKKINRISKKSRRKI